MMIQWTFTSMSAVKEKQALLIFEFSKYALHKGR